MSLESHMNETADVLRATEYPEEWDECSRDHKLTRLAVYHGGQVDGLVTMTAFGPDIESPFGFEFDITPTDARRVASWLLRAARTAE